MARVIVFDVNETLLDLAALDAPFQRAFGRPGVRREWFAQLLQSAFVSIITERDAILGTMLHLPPHPEVPAALERLRDAGLRVAALTNSTAAVATAQLTNAGLAPLFERILSADTARRLKPAHEAYETAATD